MGNINGGEGDFDGGDVFRMYVGAIDQVAAIGLEIDFHHGQERVGDVDRRATDVHVADVELRVVQFEHRADDERAQLGFTQLEPAGGLGEREHASGVARGEISELGLRDREWVSGRWLGRGCWAGNVRIAAGRDHRRCESGSNI